MAELTIRTLKASDEEAFRKAVEEFKKTDPHFEFAFRYDPQGNFADYVELLEDWSKGKRLPEAWVPHTYLVAVVDNEIVGRISIRHELNGFLRQIGGHVGYGVLSDHRGKGYASEMMKEGLRILKKLQVEKVLVTCDDSNVGSIRVIEKNGGKLEGLIHPPDLKEPKRRYWIENI